MNPQILWLWLTFNLMPSAVNTALLGLDYFFTCPLSATTNIVIDINKCCYQNYIEVNGFTCLIWMKSICCLAWVGLIRISNLCINFVLKSELFGKKKEILVFHTLAIIISSHRPLVHSTQCCRAIHILFNIFFYTLSCLPKLFSFLYSRLGSLKIYYFSLFLYSFFFSRWLPHPHPNPNETNISPTNHI